MSTEAPLSFEAEAFQCFVRGLRGVWREQAYRGAVQAARDAGTDDPAAIERQARRSAAYDFYAWLERHSQQLKYYGRHGVVRWMEARAVALASVLEASARTHPERLVLDPSLLLPDYVRAVDTHQHRGGLWSDPYDAFAYETSAGAYSFSLLDPRSPLEAYGATAAALAPDARVVLDLGCTTGNSSRTLARTLPQARVTGLDVCAPPLMLAHHRSLQQGVVVHYRQASAEALPAQAGTVDLVASHWLYHEMPPAAVRRSLAEARRVLRRGGGFMAYDMYLVPGGAVGRWLHAGYAARNNEPFAHTFAQMDLQADLERAGFTEVRIELAYPQAPPEVQAGGLPPARTHYMTMVTARAA